MALSRPWYSCANRLLAVLADLRVCWPPGVLNRTHQGSVLEVLYLAPGEIKGRLQVHRDKIDSRTFDLKSYLVAMEVTQHCIERVFQRSGLSTGTEVLNEISEAVTKASELQTVGEFGINTTTGRFLGVQEKGDGGLHLVFTTFVGNAQLRPCQRNSHD